MVSVAWQAEGCETKIFVESGWGFLPPACRWRTSCAPVFTQGGRRFSLSPRERAGVRIRRTQISRIEPLNLKMRNILIINRLILRFMGRGKEVESVAWRLSENPMPIRLVDKTNHLIVAPKQGPVCSPGFSKWVEHEPTNAHFCPSSVPRAPPKRQGTGAVQDLAELPARA